MVSGPSNNNGNFSYFDWNQFKNVTHEGMAQVFNFTWQKVPIDFEKDLGESTHLSFER